MIRPEDNNCFLYSLNIFPKIFSMNHINSTKRFLRILNKRAKKYTVFFGWKGQSWWSTRLETNIFKSVTTYIYITYIYIFPIKLYERRAWYSAGCMFSSFFFSAFFSLGDDMLLLNSLVMRRQHTFKNIKYCEINAAHGAPK